MFSAGGISASTMARLGVDGGGELERAVDEPVAVLALEPAVDADDAPRDVVVDRCHLAGSPHERDDREPAAGRHVQEVLPVAVHPGRLMPAGEPAVLRQQRLEPRRDRLGIVDRRLRVANEISESGVHADERPRPRGRDHWRSPAGGGTATPRRSLPRSASWARAAARRVIGGSGVPSRRPVGYPGGFGTAMADTTLTIFAQQVVETLQGKPQPDTVLARQMQALSLAVHIPIVCFGIAFPAMILFVEGLYLRTGDLTYKALAKRWSKVALILFAVGVVTGTILSFEFGLLWPDFMATFGEVFGLAFGLEGDLVLRRGDLHRDLRLRLGPAQPPRPLPDRHPDRHLRLRRLVQRDRGQRLDEQPAGVRRRRRRVVNPRAVGRADQRNMWHELIHMYLAGYIVAGFIVAGGLRLRVAAGPPRPLPPHGARRHAERSPRSPRPYRS